MKKLFLLMLGVLMAFPAFALTFTYTYAGQELEYTTDGMPEGEISVASNNYVSGDLIIPESVEYENTTYSVISIGQSAFGDCTSLTSVTIPNSVTVIGDGAFFNCLSLTSVTIPNSVTVIGDNAFAYCISLTSVTIPNSVTVIGDNAFAYCTSLTSVTIPNSVTVIGDFAFVRCTSLTSVYYSAEDPISGDSSIFSDEGNNSIYANATLYVPEVAVEKCNMIDPWKNFANIQAYNFSSGIGDAAADFDAGAPYEVYSLRGVKAGDKLDGLAPGVYIIRQGRAVKKVTVK